MEKDNEKITTICIPTCNRPEQLTSSLSGLIGHLQKYDRSPRILIVDDSENPLNAKESRDIVNSYSSKYKGALEFIDREDRKKMASQIAKEKNIPEEVMFFTLLGDKTSTTTIGSVRNTFLLKTRGEKIMMLDDDLVYKFFSPTEEGVPYVSITNSYEFFFLKDNDMPPASVFKPIETDFLSAHENMLGKKAGEILSEEAPEYLKDLEIMDTYMGSYGDSPMDSHLLLFLQQNVQEQLKTASVEEFQKIKNTSRIIQAPLSKTIYQGAMCVGMVMGVDNRNLVPPFFANGRSEDLVFGTTRYTAFPLKLSGYIPILIEHGRPHKESRVPTYNSFYVTNMNKVMASLSEETEDMDTDPGNNLQKMGDKFISISKEPEIKFKFLTEEQCVKNTKSIMAYIDYLLQNDLELPGFLLDYMQSIKTTLGSPDPKLFLADVTKNPTENRTVILQKWMNLYGQLLREWHKLL